MADAAAKSASYGGAVLGSVLLYPNLAAQLDAVTADVFSSDTHRKIFKVIKSLHEHGCQPDLAAVVAELGDKVDVGCVTSLIDGVMPESFPTYLRRLKETLTERRLARTIEELQGETSNERRLELIHRAEELLQRSPQPQDWRSIFQTRAEFENAPPLEFAIEGFLPERGSTFIAGLPGNSKTFVLLAMVRALLTGEDLFGYFKVRQETQRIIYLIPESLMGPFWTRIKLFHLEEFVDKRLFVHTLESKERVPLTDSRLLDAAKDSDVFIDTVARYMNGGEDIEDARILADSLFGLLRVGARTITAAHHSPKGFKDADYMCLENMVRGSGDLGAAICTAWGLRQIDEEKNRVYIKNLKPRDFLPCEPFIVQGRPHIDDRGCFDLTEPPGFAGELTDRLPPKKKGGRPQMPEHNEKQEQVLRLKSEGLSVREIAEKVGMSPTSVHRFIQTQGVPKLVEQL
jgi:hypothetical protein